MLAAVALATASPAAAAADVTVISGSLRAVVQEDPWRVVLRDAQGKAVLSESLDPSDGPAGPLGMRTATGWEHATRAVSARRDGAAVVATLATTDPGRQIEVRIAPAGPGTIALTASAPGADATGMGFDAIPGERFFGFGSRSNAVDQRGREVENYVADGPYREEDRNYTRASVPPWATRDRDDATYFPVPWMLSSRGYGTLIDNDEASFFSLGSGRAGTWSLQAESPALRLRFFAGPTPARALGRFTAATGRQPPPSAPWIFGPWFQTGQPNVIPLEDEARITRTLRDADAPVSAAETQMHYLPCGAHRGNEDYLRARNTFFHSQGLAHLAYFNPSLCASYDPVFRQASEAGVLQRGPVGEPFTYPAFVGGSGPAGFTQEPLAQFDFTNPATGAFYARLVGDAVTAGHDGWMEDFGENSPPVARSADGTPGERMHNLYPTLYHCTAMRIARRQPRPIVRFQRSGWRGSAACADNVWGGDPTTVWGFDGLSSAVTQALSMGMSGVSRWGSDIGGYNSFGPAERLTPELLQRWIEFGAVSGVMRTKRSGIAVPSYERPQVFDAQNLPVWRRYTKLHTQLHPYLLGADLTYRRTGVPLMRHHALTNPRDPSAVAQEDQFMFGDSFLAAPVTEPGARTRRVYAPAGRWVDFWRSVSFDQRTGGLVLGRTRRLRGRREHVLPAPLEQLPLLVRAGAVVPLLPADVDTLAEYGDAPGLVHLSERRNRMSLLAFPRGRSRAVFNEGERLRSAEGRRGWVFAVRGARRRVYELQASLATLRRPFEPCGVTVAGRRLTRRAWRYRSGSRVLTLRFRAKRGRVVVQRRCGTRGSRSADSGPNLER